MRDLAGLLRDATYVLDAAAAREQGSSLLRMARAGRMQTLDSIKANPCFVLSASFWTWGSARDLLVPWVTCSSPLRAGASPDVVSFTGVGLKGEDMRALAAHGRLG